ncbi:MAG: mannonate dehydratase [Longicatena sp.]
MKMIFRWYGDNDSVKLKDIAQIPNINGIVTAVYKDEVGAVWSENHILELKNACAEYKLSMEVIESVPVHEDIKLGKGDFKKYIENYKENIRRLSKYGVKCICYNFMPIFDWTRSQLNKELPDGSNVLAYYKEDISKLDPQKLALPGWDISYTPNEVKELINEYQKIGEEGLWKNLEYFLKEIIPVAMEYDVKMAIHPDDPCWPIFGIPRIITNEKNIDKFLNLFDSEYNGLTLCSGSLGCSKDNDMVKLFEKYSKIKRIHFAHIRNVKILEDGSFEESAHYSSSGSLDIVGIIKVLEKNGFNGYIRPDHGRMIWGETGKPGYGLYDRALGAMYLGGIWESCEYNEKIRKK